MVSDRQVLGLIQSTYRAALDPKCWQDLAVDLDTAIGSGGIAVHFIDEAAHLTIPIGATGFDPAFVESYVNYYGSISPWPEKFMTMPRGRARRSSMDIPDEDYERTEFYQDWMRPQEERIAAVGIRTVGTGPRSIFTTANIRRKDRDRLEVPTLCLLDRLHVHLAHAIAVNDMLLALSTKALLRSEAGGPSQDVTPGGIVIVTQERLLSWADAGAVALFGTILNLTAVNRLEFLDADVQSWFELLLDPVTGLQAFHEGTRLETTLRKNNRKWTVRALQSDGIHPGHAMLQLASGVSGRTFILVIEEHAAAQGPSDRLRRRYDLSLAEAEVALCIAEGLETDEIARIRRVSRNTVRNQIQSLLCKMDAHSRSDVIRVISFLGRDVERWKT